MNCHSFQDVLFEYVEGSVTPAVRDSAEAHLSGCPTCRQALRQHKQLGRTLSKGLQHATESLALRPDILRRLEAATRTEAAPLAGQGGVSFWWRQLMWPAGISAALVLAAALMSGVPFGSRVAVRTVQMANRETTVSIHVSYCVPIYTFHREGDEVIDSLTCDQRFVDETLLVSRK